MAINENVKAVILDLDQTLTTDTASWLQFTSLIGADPRVHAQIFAEFKLGKINYPTAKKTLINLWKTTGKTNWADINKVFKQIELRKGAIPAIEYLKRKYVVCIVTGSIDVFAEITAKKLGVKNYYASTKFIFDGNNQLVDFNYKLSRGEDKLEFFDRFCKKSGFKPEECAAIGDGESDMPIFKRVGTPILFLASETTEDQKKKIKLQIKNWKEISKFL